MMAITDEVWVTCYGDGQGQGRGVARVQVGPESLTLLQWLPLQAKPGAMLAIEDVRWLALLDEVSGQALIEVYTQRHGQWQSVERHPVPAFFSGFEPAGEAVLASSFRDGVDALITVDSGGMITIRDLHQHAYRARSRDPRQQSPHSHHLVATTDGRHALSADLGTDEIVIYRLGAKRLEPLAMLSLPDVCGPRLFAQSGDGRFVYLLCEISNAVQVYRRQDASLSLLQTLPLRGAGEDGECSAAACRLSSDERTLLITLRGEDRCVMLARDAPSGLLQHAFDFSCGRTPRDARFVGSRVLVAAQGEHALQLWQVGDGQAHCLSTLALPAPVGVY
ncbi:6-phosphogluconolactonase, cycloisomerase 2 family [Aeromonas sp. RU39B]|uniref:lactonase family protein n=1 Tax=Aeromonas sp. RU39B TaxID=1907416 RepID=UPI0009571120|nr:beta-propeller fold lactonase family protein [Aeromonas sp. RU39B]SIQ74383.1 6-phosphogluconolactonase, cycloisomerase 2 family [Aeromonas sp. RU39B]